MSLFIGVQLASGRRELFRLRALACVIGRDAQGLLTFEQPTELLAEILAVNDRYSVRAIAGDLRLDEEPLPPGTERWIRSGICLTGAGFTLHFIVTSTLAEVWAQSGVNAFPLETVAEVPWPAVTVRVGPLARTFPLPVGLELTVGSQESDGIYLPLPDVCPGHCKISSKHNGLLVTPLNGAVSDSEGVTLSEPKLISTTESIRLLPSGLLLELTWQS